MAWAVFSTFTPLKLGKVNEYPSQPESMYKMRMAFRTHPHPQHTYSTNAYIPTQANIYIVTQPCAQRICRVLFVPAKSTSQRRAQTLAVVCWTLFGVTYITNSLAEPHFKATRQVVGELLKVNTANWVAFPLKYKIFEKQFFTIKKWTLNCRVWVNKINNNILLLNKRKKQRQKTIPAKVRSEKVFLYLGRSLH